MKEHSKSQEDIKTLIINLDQKLDSRVDALDQKLDRRKKGSGLNIQQDKRKLSFLVRVRNIKNYASTYTLYV